MTHYTMRSGRLVKIFTKSGDVFTIIDSENGYSSWRMSTAVVKVNIVIDGGLVGFTAHTDNGSTYQILNYNEYTYRNNLDKYIEHNTHLSHYAIIPVSCICGEKND